MKFVAVALIATVSAATIACTDEDTVTTCGVADDFCCGYTATKKENVTKTDVTRVCSITATATPFTPEELTASPDTQWSCEEIKSGAKVMFLGAASLIAAISMA